MIVGHPRSATSGATLKRTFSYHTEDKDLQADISTATLAISAKESDKGGSGLQLKILAGWDG